jgi:hypothetical protein
MQQLSPYYKRQTYRHNSFVAGCAKSELRSTANAKSRINPRLLESGPHLHLLGVGFERCRRGRAYIVGCVAREILEQRRRERREGGTAQRFPRARTDSSVSGFSPDLEHRLRSSLIEHCREASAIDALMERRKPRRARQRGIEHRAQRRRAELIVRL